MVGYYQKSIPNYASLAVPLSGLTKKGNPEKGKRHKKLCSILLQVTAVPILHLPDLQKTFTLRTDASDVGLGGVLM